tara:strand:+ start:2483 stop:3307 length:825 start_codon:yes stop_codon:yes gene_type:complete
MEKQTPMPIPSTDIPTEEPDNKSKKNKIEIWKIILFIIIIIFIGKLIQYYFMYRVAKKAIGVFSQGISVTSGTSDTSPVVSLYIKRIVFFCFLSYACLLAYSININKMSGNNNIVIETEYLTKRLAHYIANGSYITRHESLEKFIFDVMENNRHLYAVWVCFEDDNRDNKFVYRNNSKKITLNVNSSGIYRNNENFEWYKSGVRMAELGDYEKGVWVNPVLDKKISQSILFPCVFPIVNEDSYLEGVICCCFTLYKYEFSNAISQDRLSKIINK